MWSFVNMPSRDLTFRIISDHQQTVPTHHLPRSCVHKHQRWDTGYLVLVPQLHLHGEKKEKKTEEKGRLGWRDLGVYVHFNFRGGKPFNPVKIYACLRLQCVHLKYDQKKREKVRAVYIFHRANTLSVVSKRLWRHGGRIKNTGVQSASEVN